MGKFDGRLNSLNRKLDKLAAQKMGGQVACTCGPITVHHLEDGKQTPKVPGWKCRCSESKKRVQQIVIHHSGQAFDEGSTVEATEALVGGGVVEDGAEVKEGTGEEKRTRLFIG